MSHEEELVVNGLVTISDASVFLRLSKATIYQLMETGRLQYAKIGRSRRIPKKAILNLAQDSLIGGWNIPQNNR